MSRALKITAVVAVVIAVVIAGAAWRSADAPAPVAAKPGNSLDAGALQDPTGAGQSGGQDARPVHVRIPRIGVDSDLESLGLDRATGELQPPKDYDLAGWYAGGVRPGAIGPAVIAGHVDSTTGPAVFAGLAELTRGDLIVVTSRTGEKLQFRVTRTAQSAQAEFPTSDVYANVPSPQLRLITCAGAYDRSVGRYTDNLIVYARCSAGCSV